MSCDLLGFSQSVSLPGFVHPPSVFGFLLRCPSFYFDSLMLSLRLSSTASHDPRTSHRIIRVSPRSSGVPPPHGYPRFLGPKSKVLPVDLPPSLPSSLQVPPRRFGSTPVLAYNSDQKSRASPGKTHPLPVSRPASRRFGSPDIRSRSSTPARPPPRRHLAGSLSATYTASASCFLQTPPFGKMPLPCWRNPSVR